MSKQLPQQQIPIVQIMDEQQLDTPASNRLLIVERFFVRYKDLLKWVHLVMFLVFMVLLFVPVFLPEPSEQDTPLTNFTLFTNYLMWGLWFPLVFLSVVFTGRSWCGVLCPMGAASEWANNRGLQRKIPAFIRWEGTPIVSFLIITFLGQTVGVRDHPEALAEIFGGVMLVAIIVGYIWGKRQRAWCRHMCPIGLLLGLFSRLGMVQFLSKKPKVGGDKYAENGYCPTMIDLRHKQESRHCIECFRCVIPDAKNSMMVRWRTPGIEVEQIAKHNGNAAEVWFFLLGVGSALGGFLWLVLPQYHEMRQRLGEWMIGQGWYWIGESGPWWLMSVHPQRREVFNWLDFISIIGFMALVMVIFSLVLGSINALAAASSGLMGSTKEYRSRYIELAYQYMPVAMVSLLLGLGGKLFEWFALAGLSEPAILLIKQLLFALSIGWSLRLGWKILQAHGLTPIKRLPSMIFGLMGSVFVGLCWWPALFGV
jgi:polyferredoxin